MILRELKSQYQQGWFLLHTPEEAVSSPFSICRGHLHCSATYLTPREVAPCFYLLQPLLHLTLQMNCPSLSAVLFHVSAGVIPTAQTCVGLLNSPLLCI